jgi:hypothetical protein
MSLSGGAFLHSHAKAMTHETTSATVCEGRGQVAGCDPCVRTPVLQALVGAALSTLMGSISPLMWGLQQWAGKVPLSRLSGVWWALSVFAWKDLLARRSMLAVVLLSVCLSNRWPVGRYPPDPS